MERPVRSVWMEVGDLAEMEFPQDLIDHEQLGIAVAVSQLPAKEDAYPWARYMIFFLVADPQPDVGGR